MRLRRSRLVELLAAVACVAVAAAGLRVAETRPPYEVVRGTLAAATTVDDGEITVGDVRVGTQLTRDGSVTDTTPGIFVVVAVTGAATDGDTLSRGDARLLARGDRVYADYGGDAFVTAEPGFAEQVDFVFEVDPAEMADLTIEIWRAEIIHGFQQRLQVHLGITPGNAGQWRAAAAGRAVEAATNGTTRVIP